MLAAVTKSPGVMVVDEVPEPGPPGPRDVIVRPEAVGICGSDLHFYTGDTGALSGARSFFPRIQGHEFSAVIEQLGRDCPGGVRAGDRVTVWPLRGCGRCYPCRAGRANACVSLDLVGIHRDGGLQQLLSVPVSQVFGVGDLGPEPAAFVEPMSIAVHALGRAGIPDGQQVVVLGAGPIGLATVLAATAAGARVMATDPVPARRDLALKVGAENVAWGGDGELLDAVQAWTAGQGAPTVIDTTGDPGALAQATRLVCSAGTGRGGGHVRGGGSPALGRLPREGDRRPRVELRHRSLISAPRSPWSRPTGRRSPRSSRTASRSPARGRRSNAWRIPRPGPSRC